MLARRHSLSKTCIGFDENVIVLDGEPTDLISGEPKDAAHVLAEHSHIRVLLEHCSGLPAFIGAPPQVLHGRLPVYQAETTRCTAQSSHARAFG